MIRSSIHDNRAILDQGVALLATMTPEAYTWRAAACFGSSAGGHVRHAIEHYHSFLAGLETGEVDYEARPRDGRIESDPRYAAAALAAAGAALAAWDGAGGNRPLRVRVETAPAGHEAPWTESSALRELEFLLSHTVHHYALVSVVCALQGVPTPAEFGVAPSTLRFRRREAEPTCAR